MSTACVYVRVFTRIATRTDLLRYRPRRLTHARHPDLHGGRRLGGLARQADPDRFLDTLIGAITEARWCSSDPLCIEAGGQGRDGLNLAACHGCALLPETSCEEFNLLLDRALLIGDLEGMNHRGFFGGLVAAIDESDPTT